MATSWCGLAQGRACGRGTHPVSCMRKPCGREDGMPAEPTVSRAGHTAEDPRLPARRHRSSGCRHRPRAIAPVTGDGLSRGGTAGQAGVDARTLRDRVRWYGAGGIRGLHGLPRPGRPPKLDGARTSGGGSRRAPECRIRVMASAGRCCAPASGTCPRARSIPGRIRGPGRNSATAPRGWRRRPFPTAWPRGTCPCSSRTEPAWAGRACSRGSGRTGERARASCGTTATDTCTCSPPPARRPGRRSGMSARRPAPGRRAGISGRPGRGRPMAGMRPPSPAGRAGAAPGTPRLRPASPRSGCRRTARSRTPPGRRSRSWSTATSPTACPKAPGMSGRPSGRSGPASQGGRRRSCGSPRETGQS